MAPTIKPTVVSEGGNPVELFHQLSEAPKTGTTPASKAQDTGLDPAEAARKLAQLNPTKSNPVNKFWGKVEGFIGTKGKLGRAEKAFATLTASPVHVAGSVLAMILKDARAHDPKAGKA